ncbi:MAG: hypothetical protein CM15mP108_2340 [Gammaproteobacteria bacterium]|nr:MAG: hypothetical protein CM15mP108_2340 [Gammaproteobacteria bacterium]
MLENLQAERKKLSAEFGKLKSSVIPTDELKKIIDSKNENYRQRTWSFKK